METQVNIIVGLDTVSRTTQIKQVFYDIKNGRYKSPIFNIRKTFRYGGKKDADQLKKNILDAITFSGTFRGKRRRDNIDIYNPLFVLDYDNIEQEQVSEIKSCASKCNYTYAAFISPKGNGLKVIVRTNSSLEKFNDNYADVVSYYDMLLGIDADFRGGFGVERICFVSYDPESYYNPDAKIFSTF